MWRATLHFLSTTVEAQLHAVTKCRSSQLHYVSHKMCADDIERMLYSKVYSTSRWWTTKNIEHLYLSQMMSHVKVELVSCVCKTVKYWTLIVKLTRCTCFTKFIYFEYHSTCFGRSIHPSSGVQDCTYSNRYMSNRYSYLLYSGNEMEISI
jgi:hypothetical protein